MRTSLKMWCLLLLSVLLLVSIAPTETEVVQSMTQCDGFLLEKPPKIPDILENGQIKHKNRYKAICQTYDNLPRFVTLYDTKNKIPVFSAYKYRGEGPSDKDKKRPKNVPWKVEPQLEDPKNDKNMKDCDDRVEYKHQASNKDYINTENYSRGHLFPCSYAYDESGKKSTFTLTNSVPQVQSFNEGSWSKMENCVKCILEKYCKNKEGYVLMGAKPSKEKVLNKRVNIPSMLWSAFCCDAVKGNKWLASAFWGDNVPHKSTLMKTLTELHDKLSNGHSNFVAFPGTKKCPLDETIYNHFPKIYKTCQCPPSASTTSSQGHLTKTVKGQVKSVKGT